MARQVHLLLDSPFFDPDWYLDRYPDIAVSGHNAYEHYLRHGTAEGRNPGPKFDAAWYLQQYPDVAAAGQNPLIHYIEHGEAEGREIRPVILPKQSRRPVPEGLEHSIDVLTKSRLFDPDWYLREYPDVATAGEDPAVHYLLFGATEGRNPGPDFDGNWYLKHNPDVVAAGLNPLLHYLESGAAEGREIHHVIRANAVERKLEVRFSELKPLRTFCIHPARRRLTVLLNGKDDPSRVDSGSQLAIILGSALAQHMRVSLRFAMDSIPNTSTFNDIWQANGISWSSDIEFIQTGSDRGRELGITKADFFLTTSWQTTRSLRNSVNPCRIIYLLQDDERMTYPFGDDRLLCEETLADPELIYIVVSDMLFEHLTTGPAALENIRRRGVWVERAIPIEPYISPSDWNRSSSKRNFFFDARQFSIGNLYWRGLEVIRGTLEEGLFNGLDWDFCFLSDSADNVVLPGDIRPKIMTTLQEPPCADLLRRMDVSLCLADIPYLSYPILELAAKGSVVVTNRRRTNASLARYSDNILCSDSSIGGLKKRMDEAIRLANNDELRSTNFFRQHIARDWTIALESAVDHLMSLAEVGALP